jgi:hypothetical protein
VKTLPLPPPLPLAHIPLSRSALQTLFDKKVDTAALFFVSLDIMSQRCFAFVGNFDSEVSEMAYQRLCLNRRTACHAISMGKNGGEPEENGGEPEEDGGE